MSEADVTNMFRQGTIVHINDNETDKLVNKMMGYLRTLTRKKQTRDSQRTARTSRPSVQDLGEIMDLRMDPAERIKRAATLARASGDRTKSGNLMVAPWVLNPSSLYRQSWDIVFVMLSLMYTALRVPYAIAFDIGMSIEQSLISLLCCLTLLSVITQTSSLPPTAGSC